jgi:hypothetical protein
MTSESREDDLRWLLSPPGPQEFHLAISVGEGTELTTEVQEAIEQLLRVTQQPDVTGFASCPNDTFICKPRANCAPEQQSPCYIHHTCKIGPTPMQGL